ncbi:MAG: hypothetical protein Q9M50_11205 [Methylococcales bacterium]|nr:hypothetical protein [Methylococcales bacterium]
MTVTEGAISSIAKGSGSQANQSISVIEGEAVKVDNKVTLSTITKKGGITNIADGANTVANQYISTLSGERIAVTDTLELSTKAGSIYNSASNGGKSNQYISTIRGTNVSVGQ